MMSTKKRLLVTGIISTFVLAVAVSPAMALEYAYDGDAAGQTFYQSTSTDQNYIAENGQIVVGTDGTVSSGTTGNQTSGPLSSVDLPVGEYPEAYGTQTDVDIAFNSVFPNELGPTTQNENCYVPIFIPTVESGALPTGNSSLPTTYRNSGYLVPGVALSGYTGYAPLSVYGVSQYYGNGLYQGLATNSVAMPTITKNGAIGRLSIPSISLNKYVYEGTSTANMRKGVAHFDCTSGWLGNIGLAGHNRGNYAAFLNLKNVKMGDTVYYTTAYGTNTYMVTNIKTVSVNDTSGLQQDGTNKLTMYTCIANQPEVKLCVVATMV